MSPSVRRVFVVFSFLIAASPASVWPGKDRPATGGSSAQANGPQIVPLWVGGAPGSDGKTSEEKIEGQLTHRRVSNIHKPSLTVFLSSKEKANGAGLIICPGGAHRFLSIDHEGYAVARWLADRGIAGFVLKYRLANEPGSTYKVDVHALADARRAVRLVRNRAQEWGVDPRRVGLIGFSAGGELTILAGTRFEEDGASPDPIDRVSSRPDFLALIYPGFGQGSLKATKKTPTTFLAVADDDRSCADTSITFYQALKKAGVSAELHIYAKGGHGFGMEHRPLPVSGWTARLLEWMGERGFLRPSSH